MTGHANALESNPALRTLARRQHAVVRRSQLTEIGITHDHVESHVRARRWVALDRDTVLLHTGQLTSEAMRWAAVLCAPSPAALGSWTALEIAGLHGWTRPSTHVVILHAHRAPSLPGVVVHHTRRPHLEDVRILHGLPVHRAERAAVDAAAWQPSMRTACGLLAAVVQQGIASPDALQRMLTKVGRVRHRAAMRLALADIAGGAQSLAEIDFVRFCRDYGFPAPALQARRRDARGRWRYLDAEWTRADGTTLAVEIDGVGHADHERWYDDLLRTAELDLTSRELVRVPAAAVRLEPHRVAALLARALRTQPIPT